MSTPREEPPREHLRRCTEDQHAKLRAELDELAAAGPIRAWRLRRELGQVASDAAQ